MNDYYDFPRDKDGNLVPPNYLQGIDLFEEDNNDDIINGAHIKEELKKDIKPIGYSENKEGFPQTSYKMILKHSSRMSDVFDCLPYGIIDKTITGLGATTLEIRNEVRNSIIVVPTKALAYNKCMQTNEDKGEWFCMYVGSSFGEVKKDVDSKVITQYLIGREGKIKKFIVVADSLPLLIEDLIERNIEVYKDYFLMIDEIDTMQDDSAYRPKLEAVIDYYFQFRHTNRAAVSATVRRFSNPYLNSEARLRIEWEKQPVRNVSLVHTNYVDDTAWNTINNLIETGEKKILVAYNSIDGILNIISHLKIPKSLCGIMCSERSNDKIKDYLLQDGKVIDTKGYLQKRVTFMTCAYFAGIDIRDKCHLISISSKLQPFTLLSIDKLTQIAGRLREGSLTETIIYDTYNPPKRSTTEKKYQLYLTDRADKYSAFLNQTAETIRGDKELYPMKTFLDSFMDFVSRKKPTIDSYPITIVRQDALSNRFVPAYFNIDSLVETYKLKKHLYRDATIIEKRMKQQGHKVSFEESLILKSDHDKRIIKEVKELNKTRLQNEFKSLRISLVEWYSKGRNEYKLKEIRREVSKRLQENVVDVFSTYCEHLDTTILLDGLEENFTHDRRNRNYINALIFHLLPSTHPFKASLIQSFNYRRTYDKEERYYLLKEALKAVCHFDLYLSESTLSDMLNSFFDWARGSKKNRPRGLNPYKFPVPYKHLSTEINIINTIRLPQRYY